MLSHSIVMYDFPWLELSVDVLFDAAIRIQLAERSISITFVQDDFRIKFPTTRRLAEFLEVPHYYVLPYFAMMEQEESLPVLNAWGS